MSPVFSERGLIMERFVNLIVFLVLISFNPPCLVGGELCHKVDIWQKQLDDMPGIKLAAKRLKKEKKDWSNEKLDKVVAEYKKWLMLKKAFPDAPFPMLSDTVDAVWHAHILYTREYHRECHQFFGEYLHHSPYGRLEDNLQKLGWERGVVDFDLFKAYYQKLFNHKLLPPWNDAEALVNKFWSKF